MSNRITFLPNELFIHIYKYINPISKPPEIDKRYWCCKCGEYISEDSTCVELPESPKTMATIHQRFLYSSGVSNMNIYCLRCFNSRH